jgi:TolB protein
MSSILALSKVMTTVVYGFPLVGVGVAIILASSIFTMLPLVSNQSAFGGTFPGENGKIAFSSDRDGQNEIYIMNASDGSGQTRLTNNTAVDGSPSWSPDGTKIAFHSNRDGNLEIYVMNASDGSNPTRLTNNTANDFDPSWSPDGEKIAFSSDRDDPNYEIYVMNAADGSNVKRLTNNNNTANDFEPSWSPDGTKIAFESDIDSDDYIETNYEIYVMNASDGSGQTRLTTDPAFDDPAFDVSPTWSPDGTKIAFSSDRDGQNEIYVMNASDGSGQTRLTNNIRVDFFPDWGPATEPPEEDTTPPTLTVPDDIIVEANSTEGAQITYTVTAQDNVDGNATLEDDGSTVTQDDVGVTLQCLVIRLLVLCFQ